MAELVADECGVRFFGPPLQGGKETDLKPPNDMREPYWNVSQW